MTTYFYPLAAHLAGLDPDHETQDNEDKAFEILADKYGLDDPETFDVLVKELLSMIQIAPGAFLTRKVYKGFAHDNAWLAKVEYNASKTEIPLPKGNLDLKASKGADFAV